VAAAPAHAETHAVEAKLAVEPPELPPHHPHSDDVPEELAGVAPLDEDEDREIQSMILDQVGEDDEEMDEADIAQAEAEEALQAEADGVDLSTEEPSAEAGTPGAEGAPLSAAVREPGGRYPHRTSRRMRRRGRGGDRGERGGDRPERTERPAGDDVAVETKTEEPRTRIEGRSEPRTEGRAERPEGRGEGRSEGRSERQASRPDRGPLPLITDLLKEGQEIIVQIAKEPLGQKGARITSHIALPGRYVVYMPTLEHMGVSRKIGSDEERQRLKRILTGRKPAGSGGFITRTAAEGRTEDEIAADMEFLHTLWVGIKTKAEKKPAPLLLHHDLDIVQRILRDQLTDNFKAIWVDNEEMYESIIGFVQRFQPSLVTRIKLYTREAPIFDAFNITQELEKALRPKVWLKSGGYIVINQTEALVAIDVNTGKYVGKSNRLEDTIVKTNTEAIKEIVRQVRLRDLGGIIVIDFIDMDERKNRQKVMQTLEEAMRVDRAPYKILQFNDFGLVAITRKRVKQSLERTLCSPCPHCEGAGYVKSVQTIVGEILTEARKMAASVEGKDVMLRIHPDVAKVMKSHSNKYLEELEEVLRRPVLVKSDPTLHHEKFDLA
jgi:ribonuclease G